MTEPVETPASKHPELEAVIDQVTKEAGLALAAFFAGDAVPSATLISKLSRSTADFFDGTNEQGKRLNAVLRQFRDHNNGVVIERAESMLTFVKTAIGLETVDVETAIGLLDRARGIDEIEASTTGPNGELCAQQPSSGMLDRVIEVFFSYLANKTRPPYHPPARAAAVGMAANDSPADERSRHESYMQAAVDIGLVVEEVDPNDPDDRWPVLSDTATAAWERLQARKARNV